MCAGDFLSHYRKICMKFKKRPIYNIFHIAFLVTLLCFDPLSAIHESSQDVIDFDDIEITASKSITVPLFLQQLNNGLEHNNLEEIVDALDQLIQKVPAHLKNDLNEKEGFYHSLAHTFLRFIAKHNVTSDTPKGSGETDTLIQTEKHQYLFEFKINTLKKEASQIEMALGALKQIFTRDYYKPIQQSKVPTTLVGVSFHPPSLAKRVNDAFKTITCCALELRKPNYSLYAYPHKNLTKSIGRHNEYEDFCTAENWDQFHVTGESKETFEDKKALAQTVETYSENLRNLQLALLHNDLPIVFQTIDYILQDIPWSLRLFNASYFQAVIYTALLCTGLELSTENNSITVQTDKQTFHFICSFTHNNDVKNIQKSMQQGLLTQCSELHIENDIPTSIIVFNVNQVPPTKDHDPKNKITLMSQGLTIKNETVYSLSDKKISKLSSLSQEKLGKKINDLLLTSPRTPMEPKPTLDEKKTPESPYKPPRVKNKCI